MKMIEGLSVDDFRPFMANWEAHGADANPSIASITKVGTDEGVDILKVHGKAPWPISDRIMFSARYLDLDREDGSHMMLFCGHGNEKFTNDPAIFSE